MTTVLAFIGAIGAYLLTMAVLLFLAALGASGGVCGILHVQPYRGLLKWAVIALSAGAGYATFQALA